MKYSSKSNKKQLIGVKTLSKNDKALPDILTHNTLAEFKLGALYGTPYMMKVDETVPIFSAI